MAGNDAEFIAVVNDTDPKNGGKSYALKITGNNHAQILGKRIGDVVDGIFVGEGDKTLSGYKLEITGGADKTAVSYTHLPPHQADSPRLFRPLTGYKGQVVVHKKKGGDKKRFRYKPDGLRRRRNFRGNTITQDTRQINLKVVESGKKTLNAILAAEAEEASE